jgi:NADH-quinone oxidoreductase subunit N
MTPVVAPPIALCALLPALIVVSAAFAVLLLDLLPTPGAKTYLALVALAGVVGALVAAMMAMAVGGGGRAFRDMIVLDNYALFFHVVIGYAAALVVLVSVDYLRRTGAESGEYYALVLFSASGMLLLTSANDLIVVFLAVELMSLSLYVLAGLFKRRHEAGEASMKYFLLGAFASAFLLYGIALVYGATGTTNFDRIAAAAAGPRDPLLVLGLGLLLVGFGFKISSVPFHMWAPDVYEGAPTSITAFIATGSKAAVFAVLIRFVVAGLRTFQADTAALLWALAVVSMTVGNVLAIAQTNVKRMLAYSSIAHVGYMLIGLVAGGPAGTSAVLFYLLAYTFTTAGTFGVVALCERAGVEAVQVRDYAGLGRRHPALALTLSLLLLSLVGIPPLAGFVGKFYLFGAAVRAGYVWLAVIAVLNSAVAAYYYLRVIVTMYMQEADGTPARMAPSFAGGLALVIALVGIVLLGVMPAPFADLAQAAVAPLLR